MTLDHPSATSPREAMHRPTVARREHLARGITAVETGPGVVICGDIGVGKTHLAHRVARSASMEGRKLIALSATAARRHVALGAIEPLLGPPERSVDRLAYVSAVRAIERLGSAPGESPLVQVEDAHLLDVASADVLAASCRAGWITLLITMYDDVSAPESITGLWRDQVVERIDLGPFTVGEVEDYLGETLGGGVSRELLTKAWAASTGNPMLITEAVRSALDEGALALADGGWIWEGPVRPSARLVQLVRDDLERMDDAQRDVIDAVALGGSIALDRIDRLGPGDALDRLVDSGLACVEVNHHDGVHGPRARVRHQLLADAVCELVGPVRRKRLFDRLFGVTGDGIDAVLGEPPAELVRLAVWALGCDVGIDGGVLLAAARAAAAVGDHARSVHLASAALDQLQPSDERRIDALVVRAVARRFCHEPELARRDIDEALDVLRERSTTGDDQTLARWVEAAELSADIHQYAGDDPAMAQAVLEEALTVVDVHRHHDPHGRYRRALTAGRMTRTGWAGRHLGSSEPALTLLSDRSSTDEDRLRVAAPTAMGLALKGRLDTALAITTGRLAEPREVLGASPGTFGSLASAHFVVLAWRGDLDDLGAFLERLDEIDGPYPRVHAGMQLHRRGLYAILRGQRSEAVDLLRSAAQRLEVDDPHGMRASVLGYAALASACLGDATTAKALRAEARATPLRAIRVAGADLDLAIGMVGVWLGEPDALEGLLALAERCAREGLLLTRLNVLYSVAASAWFVHGDVDLASSVSAPLDAVASEVDGELAALRRAQVRAMAAGDRSTVDRLVPALSDRGIWVPVAPAQVSLSRRQREVATLAAQGLSSRDIADRLFVSVRTIDTHLSHVFAKLGINSRLDLAEALASQH